MQLYGYRALPDVWPEIAEIFSREAVLQGSFDRYAQKGRKRGTGEVDAEFLREIERWRMVLARNIALRNRRLTTAELNFAVQRTIDRIVFLRMCEDRGTEALGTLADAVRGEGVYSNLRRLYARADQKYNSGLFHFETEPGRETPDTLTPSLNIDDRVLADIVASLYYPRSPYEFSVLPADILGNVYEQFLGKVIRLTRGHRAAVEDKPEVKKAGGVYYTPKYIVDYIVEHTVGELCRDKTLAQVAKLRILDPACGSGSFLIGAYTYLLDWHLTYYAEHPPRGKNKKVYKDRHGALRLTIAEKKRILLNNIYGVDIDGQAVEVTKLSLLLKVLEGENHDTMERAGDAHTHRARAARPRRQYQVRQLAYRPRLLRRYVAARRGRTPPRQSLRLAQRIPRNLRPARRPRRLRRRHRQPTIWGIFRSGSKGLFANSF